MSVRTGGGAHTLTGDVELHAGVVISVARVVSSMAGGLTN